MSERQMATQKNVAAQHHDEMAEEHDKHDHKLDEEHGERSMPAHKQEARQLRQEQQGQE